MVSMKRTFEDDDAVVAVNPAGLASRKFAKTNKLACEFAAADAEGINSQAAQVTPTATAAPAAPAPALAPGPASAPGLARVTMSEDMDQGSSTVCPDQLAVYVLLSSR